MPTLRREGLGLWREADASSVARQGINSCLFFYYALLPVTMGIIAGAGDQSTQATGNLQCSELEGRRGR